MHFSGISVFLASSVQDSLHIQPGLKKKPKKVELEGYEGFLFSSLSFFPVEKELKCELVGYS